MIVVDRHHLRAAFRKMRLNRRLSQADLADRLYVTQQAVQYRETRRRASMDIDVVLQTAHVFGYDVALVPSRCPDARPTGTGWPT